MNDHLSICILIAAYKRPDCLERLIKSLKLNERSNNLDVVILLDGAKDDSDVALVNSVRNYADGLKEFKSLTTIKRPCNYGIKFNIESGLREVFEKYDAAIVLEDDLVLSPYFLDFMEFSLRTYAFDKKVSQVSGFSFAEAYLPESFAAGSYFINCGECLGWGTWKRAWEAYQPDSEKLLERLVAEGYIEAFDRSGFPFLDILKHNITGSGESWAICWHAVTILNQTLCLYPVRSLVKHIVDPERSTNYAIGEIKCDPLDVKLSRDPPVLERIEILEDSDCVEAYEQFLSSFTEMSGLKSRLMVKNSIMRFARRCLTIWRWIR